ncbi:putative WD repeat-containing protein on Y chromosome [Apostichopus japonicus]|uniref:Putative WD repeat-containing protein on Y chromosome n=1 Tax=Stichopus japonicus TaxID=307972 RepID=A0A2G8JPA2_STIJA|nr:putative WD repeat-containing protein on Y chromosome [Apostichopus japonicus]
MERFEDHIKLDHLKMLMRKFDRHEPTSEMPMDGTFSPGRVIKREPGNVTLGEFKSMLTSMGIDTSEWDTQMELLFAKVDTSADGMVDWNEFCTYMLLHYRENDKVIHKQGVACLMEPTIIHIPQIKQDSVLGLVVMENPVRFITLSKKSFFPLWRGLSRFEASAEPTIPSLVYRSGSNG